LIPYKYENKKIGYLTENPVGGEKGDRQEKKRFEIWDFLADEQCNQAIPLRHRCGEVPAREDAKRRSFRRGRNGKRKEGWRLRRRG